MLGIKSVITKNLLVKVVIVAVGLLTLATSTTAAVKVAQSFNYQAKAVPEVRVTGVESEIVKAESGEVTTDNFIKKSLRNFVNFLKPTPSSSQGFELKSQKVNPNPKVASATITNTQSSGTQNSSACVVTIFGQNYDVTSLKSSHPGGDIFICGGDMSTAYQSAHGSSVSRLQPFLVGSGSTGNSNNGGQTGSTNSSGSDDENDDEPEAEDADGDDDNELESEYEDAKDGGEDADDNSLERAIEEAKKAYERQHEDDED